MAEKEELQDTLLAELRDVNLFCKLIRFPSIRDNMYKIFKVSEESADAKYFSLCHYALKIVIVEVWCVSLLSLYKNF